MSEFTTILSAGEKATHPYLPEIATVKKIINEAPNIKSFRLVLEGEKMEKFSFRPGQVGQISLFGVGEATFAISSFPNQSEYIQFSVMKMGEVTSSLFELSEGDKVGLRVPLGNGFPCQSFKGKNIVFIGGGLGMAPLRSLIGFVLENRQDCGDLKIIYGARSPKDLCFRRDIKIWQHRQDLDVVLTVDTEFPGWEHKVGFVPAVLAEEAPSPEDTVTITCGPPIMIKFVLEELKKLGFRDEDIFTTLERRMKCGIGLCGRCNIGNKYVCVDGPVFSLAELKELPGEL